MFMQPAIGVSNDKTVPALAGSRSPVFKKFIEMLVTRIHLGASYGIGNLVRQFTRRENLRIATLEALVLIGRDHDRAIPFVAGYDNRFPERQILITTDFLTEFRRRYAYHLSTLVLWIIRNIAETRENF
jgi:hypothetical protein